MRRSTQVDSSNLCMSRAQVWNPSFDVTPANLLTGIITEHGVIQRTGQTFPVAEFLRAEVHR